jgi:signal transduction histidine kinase
MVAEELRRASATAGDALIEARLTLLGLASSPLGGRTLEDALRSEVARARSTGHLEVGFEIDGLLDAPAQIAIRTFRAT